MIVHSQLALWTPLAQAEFDDTWKSILDDPCIKRFDSTIKLVILRIAFSSFGFGWCLLQPRDDAASVSAAQDYRDGKGFSFMRPCRRYFIQYTSALAKLVAMNLGCTLTLVKVSRETMVLTSVGSISLLNGFFGLQIATLSNSPCLWRFEPCYHSIADAAYVLGCWYCLSTRHWTCRFRLLIPYRSRFWVWPSLCSVLTADSAASQVASCYGAYDARKYALLSRSTDSTSCRCICRWGFACPDIADGYCHSCVYQS